MSEIGQSVTSFIKWFKEEEKQPQRRLQSSLVHLAENAKLGQNVEISRLLCRSLNLTSGLDWAASVGQLVNHVKMAKTSFLSPVLTDLITTVYTYDLSVLIRDERLEPERFRDLLDDLTDLVPRVNNVAKACIISHDQLTSIFTRAHLASLEAGYFNAKLTALHDVVFARSSNSLSDESITRLLRCCRANPAVTKFILSPSATRDKVALTLFTKTPPAVFNRLFGSLLHCINFNVTRLSVRHIANDHYAYALGRLAAAAPGRHLPGLIQYWIVSAQVPVAQRQKLQICRIIAHAAKALDKGTRMTDDDELIVQLNQAVQSNLNQVDLELREWSLLAYSELIAKVKCDLTPPDFDICAKHRNELDVDLSDEPVEAFFALNAAVAPIEQE